MEKSRINKKPVSWNKKKEKEWDSNAGFWIKIIREKLDPYRLVVTDRAILKQALGPKRMKVLDAGCGEGYLCRRLAEQGHQIYGVDISRKLIEAAQDLENKSPLGVTYRVGDFKKTGLPTASFDLVLSNHTIYETGQPEKAVREFARLLKRGGRLVFLLLHPCFDVDRIPKDHLPLSVRYFQKNRVNRGYYCVSGLKSPFPYFYTHLPLSKWINLVTDNGFSVTAIKEPHPSLGLISKSPLWRKKFQSPMFILIEATRA